MLPAYTVFLSTLCFCPHTPSLSTPHLSANSFMRLSNLLATKICKGARGPDVRAGDKRQLETRGTTKAPPGTSHALAPLTVLWKLGSTSCTTLSHRLLAHSTLLCCRKRMRRCAGAAWALTMARMSSGVRSASPFLAWEGQGGGGSTQVTGGGQPYHSPTPLRLSLAVFGLGGRGQGGSSRSGL